MAVGARPHPAFCELEKDALSEKSRFGKLITLSPYLPLWLDCLCSAQPAQPCVVALRGITPVCKWDLRRTSEETSVRVLSEALNRRKWELSWEGSKGRGKQKETRHREGLPRWREACEWRGMSGRGWEWASWGLALQRVHVTTSIISNRVISAHPYLISSP